MSYSDKSSPPQPLAPIPFHVPESFSLTLGNGLRVVLFQDKRVPLVSFRLAFRSGDVTDPKDAVGLTSALSAMLTEGTLNYSSQELAEKIERLGASLSAGSSDDFTIVAASALSIYRSEMLQMIAEIVFRPTFPEGELDLYRRNTIENLKFQRSQPGFLAGEQVARVIYGEHPYSVVSPSGGDIVRLTREQLERQREELFVPGNAILLVVGDFERDEFLREISDEFGSWQGSATKTLEFPDPPKRSGRSVTIVDRPGSAQANIVIANLAIDRLSPDYFPVLVMNQILGAGASSRVFMNLREEKGYTYGAYTRIDARRFAGDLEATAEVRTSVTGDAMHEFFYELNRIRTDRVSDDELRDAKSFLTGVFPIRAETQEGLTSLIINQQLYGLPSDYLQTYRENVDAVTAEQVLDAAVKYVRPHEAAIVVVGDANEIMPQVKSYAAEIEIFDSEGRAIEILATSSKH